MCILLKIKERNSLILYDFSLEKQYACICNSETSAKDKLEKYLFDMLDEGYYFENEDLVDRDIIDEIYERHDENEYKIVYDKIKCLAKEYIAKETREGHFNVGTKWYVVTGTVCVINEYE